MQAKKLKYGYVEWLSAQEMHEDTLKWMSELNFTRDEQLFLNDLVKSYTIQLTDTDIFEESRKLVEDILQAEKDSIVAMKKVQAHENRLEIMVNDVDELKMEKAYLETHWELLNETEEYLVEYRKLKKRLFKLVSKVMKAQKQKRLLN
jgi:hypothetical protein